MISVAPNLLTGAVAAICPDIQKRVASHKEPFTENRLWWELSTCLLSSQVPFFVATAAADAIEKSGLLLDENIETEECSTKITEILSTKLLIHGKQHTYRFPVAKARQLAATRAAVHQKARTLRELLSSFSDATIARSWFVDHAPGLGPKQASMFLRNIGISYDLAILDRHVLNYMEAVGISNMGEKGLVSGLLQYRRYEAVLRLHAEKMGFAVGLMDWAIWIVMREAQKPNLELAFV